MVKICCSLLLLSLLSVQLKANPGLKVRITQKALEYGRCPEACGDIVLNPDMTDIFSSEGSGRK